MKDALGHGSNPRGGASHQEGVNSLGHVEPGVWFHGSPIGEPGEGPVHVGTQEAARQALEARIGIPADGRDWDGTREYGKTLLAGSDTQERMAAAGIRHSIATGFNVGSPKNDYYPHERGAAPLLSAGTPFSASSRPAIHAFEIHGRMSNNPAHPMTDARANGVARRLKNQGTYYKNIGEDSGSVSAVVPSAFLKRRG